jgi:hypothetical protein
MDFFASGLPVVTESEPSSDTRKHGINFKLLLLLYAEVLYIVPF